MSTVQSLLDNIGARADSTTTADMYPIINLAIRTIAKRLYVLRSDIIRKALSLGLYHDTIITYELLTLDVNPATAWEAGDIITGQTSGAVCTIVSVITTKTFYVKDRVGTYTLNEIVGVTGTAAKLADQGAANPTVTSLMALVDGGASADTITYAAAQFLVEGFEAGMTITTSHASNPGPFKIATAAAGTLTLESTDVVTAATSNSFIITSVTDYALLPGDFWGFIDKPYLDGYTTPLLPLPSQEVAMQYLSSGFPLYYQIKGRKLYTYPPPGDDYTVLGDYFYRPTAVSATTSVIPFDELFDDAIGECIMQFYRKGFHEQNYENPPIERFLSRAVDMIAVNYGRVGAQYATTAINWGRMV